MKIAKYLVIPYNKDTEVKYNPLALVSDNTKLNVEDIVEIKEMGGDWKIRGKELSESSSNTIYLYKIKKKKKKFFGLFQKRS